MFSKMLLGTRRHWHWYIRREYCIHEMHKKKLQNLVLCHQKEESAGNFLSTFIIYKIWCWGIKYPNSIDEKNQIKCNICGKRFPTEEDLQNHLIKHDDKSRTFKCQICPKAYVHICWSTVWSANEKKFINDYLKLFKQLLLILVHT